MKDKQIAGSHYAKLKIDPFTFAMRNGLDPMLFSIVKYVTRYKDKGTPLADLQKALHIAEYRKQFAPPQFERSHVDLDLISPTEYCGENKLDFPVFMIVRDVFNAHIQDSWSVGSFNRAMDIVITGIQSLIEKVLESPLCYKTAPAFWSETDA
jgi:Protein of unknwon function (DUF3310)